VFFVSVADKGVTGALFVSVDSKRVAGGRFRLISGKTRKSAVSVADKGDRAFESWQVGRFAGWEKSLELKKRF
jgi:hypothetical protein